MKREALLKKSKKGGETGAGLPDLREEKGGGAKLQKHLCSQIAHQPAGRF